MSQKLTIEIPEWKLEEWCELVARLRANGDAVDSANWTEIIALDREAANIYAELAGSLVGLLVAAGLVEPLV